MTEISRVPLKPVSRGSLAKLWGGVALAVAAAGGIAWAAAPQGVEVETLAEGKGASPGPQDVVFVRYVGKLADTGTEFDRSSEIDLPVKGIFPEGTPLPLENMIPGFRDGALQMRKGGRYRIEVPSELGYGAEPQPGSPIPPNADLVFDVELIDFMSRAEFEQRLAALQQILQSQGALPPSSGGGAGAPPPGTPAP